MICTARLGLLVLAICLVSTARAQSPNSTCTVQVTLSPGWTNAAQNTTIKSLTINVINNSPVSVTVPWTLTLNNQFYGAVQQTFNLNYLNGSSGTFSGQASNFFQTLVPFGNAAAGVIIEVSNGTGMPTSASLNGDICTVTTAPPSPPSPPSQGAIESAGSLSTSNGQIIGVNGQPLRLQGLNYFGFDDGNTMVDGLWVGSESITQDFATIVYRQQLLGFNAVRLPFSFVSLFDSTPKTETYQCTQDAMSVIVASTVAPGVNPTGTAPSQTAPASAVPGVCNSYLPEDTVLNRFMFVVNFYASNGFYIILDNQFNLDQTAINNQAQWIQRWTSLMTQLTNQYPNAAAMCLCDLLNEPDAFKLQWSAQNGLPGVGDLYLAAMDAIYPVNPGVLFLIEGAGQNGLAMNWGDGIAVDPAIIAQLGLSDPNPFFKQLLTKPYLGQVVAAPHVYPPSISKATTATTGAALWKRLSQSFGYLNKQGYCSGSNTVGAGTGTCHLFPVLIGETGSAFSGSLDVQPMADFAAWCNNAGQAVDGLHNAVSGVFWWAWNANSGDTGGFVEDDWETIRWDKIAWMQSVGLSPWYAPSSTASATPSVPATSPPVAASPPPLVASPPPVSASPPPLNQVGGTPPAPVVFATTPPATTTTPSPPGCSAASTAPPPSSGTSQIESAGSQLQPLTTQRGVIYGVDGGTLDLQGVTFYGFDNGTAPNGLVGSSSISVDFATQLQRIVNLGFNTIELPFSFKALLSGAPSVLPTNCTITPYQQLLNDTNPPSIVLPYGTMFNNLTAAPSILPDGCNTYLSSETTLDRFVSVVNLIAANGLYVRLSNRLDIDDTAVQSPQNWIDSWSRVITQLSQNENTQARLLISPLTNPDIGGMRWNPAYGVPGATDLFIRLMDALYTVNTNMLFLIQGPNQVNLTGLGGSSYVTNIPNADIPNNLDADPNAFFKQVLVKSYVSQVVIAPRVLSPSLADTSNSSSGTALFSRLTNSFGYLNKQGYCTNSQCKEFAIAISGFGSPLATAQDNGFETDLASWLTNANIANDGMHNPVSSYYWNGWDSSSYGPILANDSITLDYTKLDFLSTIGLSPWYFPPTVHRTLPAIPATYANTTVSNGSFCSATTSVSLSGSSTGATGGTFLGSVAVTLVNTGQVAVNPPWTVTLGSNYYQAISQAFGLVQTQVTATGVSGVASATYNILWPQSTNQVTVGFVIVSSNTTLTPTQVQLNGVTCTALQGTSAASASAPAALTGGSLGGAESVGSGVISLSSNTLTGVTAYAATANDGNSR